jgi:hypothetical protein
MSESFRYVTLTDDDRKVLIRERLRKLEADHFRLCLEVRLAEVTGDAEKLNIVAQVELAGCEVRASALRAWLEMEEPVDA